MNRRNVEEVRVFHGRRVEYRVTYEDPIRFECTKNGCKGVRNDKIILCESPKEIPVGLLFDSPCICGSFLHRSTRSLKCFLNKRYLDSIEVPDRRNVF